MPQETKLPVLAKILPGLDVKRLIEKVPQVLSLDVGVTVLARCTDLVKLLPNADVLSMARASREPMRRWCMRVFNDAISGGIIACGVWLRSCVRACLGPRHWWKIEAQPQLLTVSVQRCVAPNWAALQWRLAREGVSLAAAERVVQAMPRLLATTPGTIDARVSLLEARRRRPPAWMRCPVPNNLD